jgi:hypothetical protein
MSNLKKFIKNYVYQLKTLNQLIRLNSPLKSEHDSLMVIKTYNKYNVKGEYLFLLIWNTLINSPELWSTYYYTKSLRVYVMSVGKSPLLLHRSFELSNDTSFDDYWAEIKDQIIDQNIDYYYINITIYFKND